LFFSVLIEPFFLVFSRKDLFVLAQTSINLVCPRTNQLKHFESCDVLEKACLRGRRDISRTGPSDSLDIFGTLLSLISICLHCLLFRFHWFGLQFTAPCFVSKRFSGILEGSSCCISRSLLVRTIWPCLVTTTSYAHYNMGTGKKCITYD